MRAYPIVPSALPDSADAAEGFGGMLIGDLATVRHIGETR